MPLGAWPVDVVEFVVVAGGGADVAREEVTGYVWFRRDWLEWHGLDSARCAVIGVRGESMEPTLPDNDSILVARSRTGWRHDHIYALRAEDGLIGKSAGVIENGSRLLVSDHPAREPVLWPQDAELVGEARWVARTFGLGGTARCTSLCILQ